ncbi:putative uroporphyrinogen-III C-methyltransferase [Vanrija pseudolonga]|uniref:precorrin-2 dehydrogenase n=1 Tax=Vanrija pseudolonga TaxID=143232 RepID=A0AAF0YKN9_9TREE|nr:putative uroporphyrinogen-III C-methyltransferase [Vanrija pseudolonga]
MTTAAAAYKTPSWVHSWLLLSSLIVLSDFVYCVLRCSLAGGDPAGLWAHYKWAILDVAEFVLNYIALGDNAVAPLFGFASAVMTASKPGYYFIQGLSGWTDSTSTFWAVWAASNAASIFVPTIVALVLGTGIARTLIAHAPPPKEPVSEKPTAPRGDDKLTTFPTPIGGAPLPLTFHVKGRPVLVFGSNKLAASRVFTLLEADAQVIVASDAPFAELPAEIQFRVNTGEVRYQRFAPRDAHDWKGFLKANKVTLLAVTDTLIGSAHTAVDAAAAYTAATELFIPINVSDRPALSTYTFPSVHRFAGVDGPSHLQVAVSTNGQGCRLGGRIRREIVSRLPLNVGAAVDNIGRLRARAKMWQAAAAVSEDDINTPLNAPVAQGAAAKGEEQFRRMRWVQQMSEYYSYDQLAALGAADMDATLEGEAPQVTLPHHDGQKGKILLVGSGPGHPGLLTVAARHALENATLILSDKLVPAEIINLIPSSTKLIIAKKFPGNAEGAQSELMDLALQGARAGETVVRLKQGDPFVYGRGGEEVLFFREHGYEAVVVPGVSSALAGPLMHGIPVTQRGVADSLVMCTGVGRAGSSVELPGYVKSRTLCILMGVARIEKVVSVLTGAGQGRDGAAYPGHLPVAIVERASSPDQRVILSTLDGITGAIASVDQRPPGMILVGWAALALEGKGNVDVLDGVDEKALVGRWLDGKAWKTREGLPTDWSWFG